MDAKWADLEPRDRQDLGFGFLTFVIMLRFFVPMSLYVTFDLASVRVENRCHAPSTPHAVGQARDA